MNLPKRANHVIAQVLVSQPRRIYIDKSYELTNKYNAINWKKAQQKYAHISWHVLQGLVLFEFSALLNTMSSFRPGARFTDNFAIIIQIWWIFHQIIQILNQLIATGICTYHNSCAVVVCANICSGSGWNHNKTTFPWNLNLNCDRKTR